ncbi:MAG: M20/M25/M40 family metallo-hydrolase [Bacteroidota bacterium]
MKKNILGFILSFCSLAVVAQQGGMVDPQMEMDMVYLASDYLEGRETGKAGEAKAAAYIIRRFEQIGLSPKGVDGSWVQPFSFTYQPNPHAGKKMSVNGKNVVGFIDNGAATTVVIGAHYDHVGMGNFGSRHSGGPAIHNGADDNASGVTALLYLAEQLKGSTLKNNNYLFIAFSGEEFGLFGSKHFVDEPTIDLGSVNYMFNMDMVGRMSEDKQLVVNGAGTSPVWKQELNAIKSGGIKVTTTDSGVGPSDHTSFYKKDIPVLHFFTGQNKDYHTPEDDARFINFAGMQLVSDFMLELMERLDDDGKIAFSKTKEETGSRRAAKYKVTLGIMPDYSSDAGGLRIDAVLDDRPAAVAGMEDGDIITKMGDFDVKDIYGYMEALSKFKKGDRTIVVVRRGKELIEKIVEF